MQLAGPVVRQQRVEHRAEREHTEVDRRPSRTSWGAAPTPRRPARTPCVDRGTRRPRHASRPELAVADARVGGLVDDRDRVGLRSGVLAHAGDERRAVPPAVGDVRAPRACGARSITSGAERTRSAGRRRGVTAHLQRAGRRAGRRGRRRRRGRRGARRRSSSTRPTVYGVSVGVRGVGGAGGSPSRSRARRSRPPARSSTSRDAHRGQVASGGSQRWPHASHTDTSSVPSSSAAQNAARRPTLARGRDHRSTASTSAEPSMSAPEVTTHVSRAGDGAVAGAALQLEHGLGHRVHPVQVALGEQAAVRVHRERSPRAHELAARRPARRARAPRGP